MPLILSLPDSNSCLHIILRKIH